MFHLPSKMEDVFYEKRSTKCLPNSVLLNTDLIPCMKPLSVAIRKDLLSLPLEFHLVL